jgi:hypothetical protein
VTVDRRRELHPFVARLEDDGRLARYHEAGHAVLAVVSGVRLGYVEVFMGDNAHEGLTRFRRAVRAVCRKPRP